MKTQIALFALIALTACNSSENKEQKQEVFSCSAQSAVKPEMAVVMPRPVVEKKAKIQLYSSDGKLKVEKNSGKMFLGEMEIKRDFEFSAPVVNCQLVNDGEYLVLTDDSFTGKGDEEMKFTKAYHCKLVDTTLQLIPMKTFADEAQSKYDSSASYSVAFLNNFWENEEDQYLDSEEAQSHYLNYNADEKSFLYKETNRDFVNEEEGFTYYEIVGKFEYRDGAFYQVKEKMRKI
ncbi:MAG: hypothetical protein NT150_04460 [Bacteroidetes bacterium]|nr:hypothetical protein [Bacteroidota bacterium]